MPITPNPQLPEATLRSSLGAETDTLHWYGLKFPDLDVPHQVPFLTAEELGQATPKLTIELAPGEYGIAAESKPTAEPAKRPPTWRCAACGGVEPTKGVCRFWQSCAGGDA